MTISFYILISLSLVIIKTVLIPGITVFSKFYDLLIPIIVYLGFFRSTKEGLPIVVFSGLIMDSLSGGPVGLYFAAYLWLYLAGRWMSLFLHGGNIFLITIAVAIGVMFEILILLGYLVFLAPGASMPEDAIETITIQLLLAIITAPVILSVIGWAQKKLDRWRASIVKDRRQY
ncbi:MAG: hypothetical protein GY874_07295 [Desulfobacteraceae bacterium]|nr:hypothetical protein [Desulfobacteraceae bacterium]